MTVPLIENSVNLDNTKRKRRKNGGKLGNFANPTKSWANKNMYLK